MALWTDNKNTICFSNFFHDGRKNQPSACPFENAFFSVEHVQIRILQILSRIILVLLGSAFDYSIVTLVLQVKNKVCG